MDHGFKSNNNGSLVNQLSSSSMETLMLARSFASTVAAMFCLLMVGSASAQESEVVSRSEFDALLHRLENQELLLAESTQYAPPAKSFCYPCSTQAGMEFGAELLLLRPYQSEGESPGFDLFAAPRMWIGYAGERGYGARVRWFDYEAENRENDGSDIADLDLTVIDFELTDRFRLGHWDGELSGGLRYADYREYNGSDFSTMENSLGFVVGVSVERQCTEKWALFGLVRTSFQFATEGIDSDDLTDDAEMDVFFRISEFQFGAERLLWKGKGGKVSLRTVAEAQNWSGGLVGDDSEDLGLVGGSVGIVLAR